MELAQKHSNDPSALKIVFNSLVLICKIFYSLNFQVSHQFFSTPWSSLLHFNCELWFLFKDLPEFFEDNMGTWMTHFHTLLVTDNKLLQTDVKSFSYNLYFPSSLRVLSMNKYVINSYMYCGCVEGWRGGGSSWTSEVGYLRQRGDVRAEVRRGVRSAPATVRRCCVEPAHQHWPASQIRLG